MKLVASLILFLSLNVTTIFLPECFANDPVNQVTISDVKPENEGSAANQKWTENERSEEVSKYGVISPVQVPINYMGKGFDVLVSGIGKVLTTVISFPLKALPHRSPQNTGGQNAKEEDKKS